MNLQSSPADTSDPSQPTLTSSSLASSPQNVIGSETTILSRKQSLQPTEPAGITTTTIISKSGKTLTESQMESEERNTAANQGKKSSKKKVVFIFIGLGATAALIIAILLIIVFNRKKMFCWDRNDEDIYFDATQFQHRGPLQVKDNEQFKLEANRDSSNEVREEKREGHFTFTTAGNEVFDIGTEVEEVVN
ncbi:hypothetical protein Tcan_03277 [Toxocara canis]|uniref:Uncharacterized protein n=1 Tax=Toxocara canis TaxID=6265 RepID=A0A0B2VGV9_TOXCA|nr:hypothetical protein Tcan_03277 [Toxocara canis]